MTHNDRRLLGQARSVLTQCATRADALEIRVALRSTVQKLVALEKRLQSLPSTAPRAGDLT